ncbi:MAG: hypothetical protein WCA35_23640 [Kovacikia sp.]
MLIMWLLTDAKSFARSTQLSARSSSLSQPYFISSPWSKSGLVDIVTGFQTIVASCLEESDPVVFSHQKTVEKVC